MTPPPERPEDWTDEQWLAWLEETDRDGEGDDGGRRPEPTGTSGPASFPTQVMRAAMVGMAEAIYGPKEEPAIVMEAAGSPPRDDGLDVHLDPQHPEQSVAVVRPWLLPRRS